MTKADFKTLAVSTLGALALSATCVVAAVGPARAATGPASTAAWQRIVSDRVSAQPDVLARGVRSGHVAEPVLALRFDAAGDFAGAELRRSSGLAAVDREALSVARQMRYPALPATLRGTPQTVEMRLTFGAAEDIARHRVQAGEATMIARADGFRVASR